MRLKYRRVPYQLKFPICGQVTDVDGDLWDVRDVRITRHGFHICYGTPAHDHGAFQGGVPRIIATEPLRKFWEDNRLNPGMTYDLPAGRTTLKRVRKRLRFNFVRDRTKFWTDRLDDLANLPPHEFAAKHGANKQVTFDRRLMMVGRTARYLGWWNTPETVEILLSDITLREVGQKLGISIAHAKRLRDRAIGAAKSTGT